MPQIGSEQVELASTITMAISKANNGTGINTDNNNKTKKNYKEEL